MITEKMKAGGKTGTGLLAAALLVCLAVLGVGITGQERATAVAPTTNSAVKATTWTAQDDGYRGRLALQIGGKVQHLRLPQIRLTGAGGTVTPVYCIEITRTLSRTVGAYREAPWQGFTTAGGRKFADIGPRVLKVLTLGYHSTANPGSAAANAAGAKLLAAAQADAPGGRYRYALGDARAGELAYFGTQAAVWQVTDGAVLLNQISPGTLALSPAELERVVAVQRYLNRMAGQVALGGGGNGPVIPKMGIEKTGVVNLPSGQVRHEWALTGATPEAPVRMTVPALPPGVKLLDENDKALQSGTQAATAKVVAVVEPTTPAGKITFNLQRTLAPVPIGRVFRANSTAQAIIAAGSKPASDQVAAELTWPAAPEPPQLQTSASALQNDATPPGKQAVAGQAVQIRDLVKYQGLLPGTQYTVRATLMLRATGKPVPEVVSQPVTFRPATAAGEINVGLLVPPAQVKTGVELVVFEELFVGTQPTDNPVAVHKDLAAVEQTVTVVAPTPSTTTPPGTTEPTPTGIKSSAAASALARTGIAPGPGVAATGILFAAGLVLLWRGRRHLKR